MKTKSVENESIHICTYAFPHSHTHTHTHTHTHIHTYAQMIYQHDTSYNHANNQISLHTCTCIHIVL